jgi:hypothetical protein
MDWGNLYWDRGNLSDRHIVIKVPSRDFIADHRIVSKISEADKEALNIDHCFDELSKMS